MKRKGVEVFRAEMTALVLAPSYFPWGGARMSGFVELDRESAGSFSGWMF